MSTGEYIFYTSVSCRPLLLRVSRMPSITDPACFLCQRASLGRAYGELTRRVFSVDGALGRIGWSISCSSPPTPDVDNERSVRQIRLHHLARSQNRATVWYRCELATRTHHVSTLLRLTLRGHRLRDVFADLLSTRVVCLLEASFTGSSVKLSLPELGEDSGISSHRHSRSWNCWFER